ncbi:MAG: DegT/DnrJ/EryC1/StrS family aminotransferase [Anaerolineales bacterium]
MNIPLVDLTAQYRAIKDEIDAAVLSVLESGRFILGPQVAAFEAEVADYLGVRHAIGVASGTDALVIALRALGIGAGDEVIVPAYSFFATAGAVLSVGARPVFVDIQPGTYLMAVEQVETAITPATKAILPVHLYGQPADMDEILTLAREYHLAVIEDNAQAFGAEYKGRKTGALGDVGCLSFFPSKNLGGYGDGGMLTTNDDRLAESMRMLRTHGWKKKYFPEMLGYNSRLDELQAAVLRVKLRHLDEWNRRRREIAALYHRLLADLPLGLPLEAPNRTHVYHLYVISLSQRDELQQELKKAGIASEVYYPQPLHLAEPCHPLGYQAGQFPLAEQASRALLALPLYPELEREQVQAICSALADNLALGKRK